MRFCKIFVGLYLFFGILGSLVRMDILWFQEMTNIGFVSGMFFISAFVEWLWATSEGVDSVVMDALGLVGRAFFGILSAIFD